MAHGRDLLLLHVTAHRPRAPRYQRQLDELNAAATAAIEEAGWRPELLATAGADTDHVLALARAADAVVVMGGEDVDPRLYGGPARYPGGGTHVPDADRVQIATILQAVRRGTPLLGICRGHQLLNVALGGTLVPHMKGHRSPGDDPFVRTTVHCAPGESRAFAVGDGARCTHHQAIQHLGDGLRIAARASDGTIEAVAHRRAPVVGVQWHPEHPDAARTQLVPLLETITSPAERAAS